MSRRREVAEKVRGRTMHEHEPFPILLRETIVLLCQDLLFTALTERASASRFLCSHNRHLDSHNANVAFQPYKSCSVIILI